MIIAHVLSCISVSSQNVSHKHTALKPIQWWSCWDLGGSHDLSKLSQDRYLNSLLYTTQCSPYNRAEKAQAYGFDGCAIYPNRKISSGPKVAQETKINLDETVHDADTDRCAAIVPCTGPPVHHIIRYHYITIFLTKTETQWILMIFGEILWNES
jgi:hypothetical protein